jgi:hypothetical protein
MVTPPFKFGEPINTTNDVPVAADGSRLTFNSLGAFGEPGADAATEAGSYIGVRGALGWSAVAVNPSATQFQAADPAATSGETTNYSSDLSRTLFLEPPASAKPVDARFYVRALDGSVTEAGALVSPEIIARWTPGENAEGKNKEFPNVEIAPKATGDLSHVFFGLARGAPSLKLNWLWPGDETATSNSLYEYTGTGNSEPELVGVRNPTSLAAAAAAQGKAHINEAAELISQCGVDLGGNAGGTEPTEADTYNAFSASGEIVAFTALGHNGPLSCSNPGLHEPEVNELYVRLGRARTVAISEPTTGPGGDCELCDEIEPKNAVFAGASEDGSKVFFESEQNLLAGSAGLQPSGNNLYVYDFTAPAHNRVKLIAPDLASSGGHLGGVARVSEDGSSVYFVSTAGNLDSLGKLAKNGDNNLYADVPDPIAAGHQETVFIGALSSEDEQDWSAHDLRPVEATPDGRFLLFRSTAHLTADAAGTGRQLYRYEAPTEAHHSGVLLRATIGEAGFNENGNSAAPPSSRFAPEYANLSQNFQENNVARPVAASMSADGSRVFFESPVALVQGALNDACALELFGQCSVAATNIYEWEAGHIYLISDGQDAHTSLVGAATRLIGANPSGTDVFFTTADPLVPQDIDNTGVDIYDARIAGGFPAPAAVVGCRGEACQGPSASSPAFGAPASTALNEAGNLVPPPPPSTPVSKRLTRAQLLATALKACRTKHDKHKRTACERQAHKRYGPPHKAKAKARRGGK